MPYEATCAACGKTRMLKWPDRTKSGMCQPCYAKLHNNARPEITNQMLIDDYESGLSTVRIGEKYRMNQASVIDRLRRAGHPLRARSTGGFRRDIDTSAIIGDYKAGASSNDLAAKYGLGKGAILSRIRKAGVRVRGRMEATQHRVKKLGHEVEIDEHGRFIVYCTICGGKRILLNRPPLKCRHTPCHSCSLLIRFGPPTATRERQMATRRLMDTEEYRAWRSEVFERDEHECQMCFSKGPLQAHHIKVKRHYPELVLDIGNGITLCKGCHTSRVFRHERDYEEKFEAILDNRACGVL